MYMYVRKCAKCYGTQVHASCYCLSFQGAYIPPVLKKFLVNAAEPGDNSINAYQSFGCTDKLDFSFVYVIQYSSILYRDDRGLSPL